MYNEQDSITKLYIDLPNQGGTGGPGGESVWALHLGDDLYGIRNVPFFAYGINWGDVVKADAIGWPNSVKAQDPDEGHEIS
jgi:hypothetical protein